MTSRIHKLFFDWHKPVNAASLAFYRICFGALMLFSTIRFLANGWVHDFYIKPTYHFSYYGFDWLPYPNANWLYLIFALMLVSALGIMLGLFYRFSAITFFLAFTYIELLDKTTYLNHYYFVSLCAFILIFLPANVYCSLDNYFGFKEKFKTVPNYTLGILKFQMGIVYVFAGIAKLESDWLIESQPLKIWLHTKNHWPFLGDFLKHDFTAYFFSWFGCIYDLTIVFFLLHKSTRNYAFIFVVLFHLFTWILFPIGVFPWVMIVGTTIFLSDKIHENFINFILNFFKRFKSKAKINYGKINYSKQTVNLLFGLFIIFQIMVPFRYLLYPGNLFWTEQGFRFSWRVMLMEKTGYAQFYLVDKTSNFEWLINNENHLTRTQEKMMSTQPDMILQYAHYLAEVYQDTTLSIGSINHHFQKPEVHAEIYVTLNGRPSQLFVDKKHNLAAISNSLKNKNWIEPFVE